MSGTPRSEPGILRMVFRSDTGEVRRARREVGRLLDDHGVVAELAERTLLVVSELVTNAFEASPALEAIELVVTAGGSMVSVGVENACTADPSTIAFVASTIMPVACSERGRGLPLVAATAARLSITLGPGRVRVGADLMERS